MLPLTVLDECVERRLACKYRRPISKLKFSLESFSGPLI